MGGGFTGHTKSGCKDLESEGHKKDKQYSNEILIVLGEYCLAGLANTFTLSLINLQASFQGLFTMPPQRSGISHKKLLKQMCSWYHAALSCGI